MKLQFPNKIVILEGPDGSGKTTLARFLEEHHGFEYRHEGPPPPGVDHLQYYGQLLYDSASQQVPVVWDRFHIGQAVYGPILRDDHSFGEEELLLMARMTAAYGAMVVACMTSYAESRGNWLGRKGELFQDNGIYEKVYAGFERQAASYTHRLSLTYDYTKMPSGVAANILQMQWNGVPKLPLGCTGYPFAKFLFVGERANHDKLEVPFFSTEDSSGYLTECLRDAGYKDDELAFVNAQDIQGVRNDDILKELAATQRTVVALGSFAKQSLNNLGIPFKAIDHPQYFRRFHRALTPDYVAALKLIRETHVAAAN